MQLGPVKKFQTLDSTNSYIKRIIEESKQKDIANGTVVLAINQTAGRGRHGRSWLSDQKDCLTFSIYLKLTPEIQIQILPLLTGLAISNTLNNDFAIEAKLKWPNDVMVNHKKICGVLCEAIPQHDFLHVIIGIGLNINAPSDFLSIIDRPATSMSIETGLNYDKDLVLSCIISQISTLLTHWQKEGFSAVQKDMINSMYAMGTNTQVILSEKVIASGIISGIDSDGRLILINNGHETHIDSGELYLQYLP